MSAGSAFYFSVYPYVFRDTNNSALIIELSKQTAAKRSPPNGGVPVNRRHPVTAEKEVEKYYSGKLLSSPQASPARNGLRGR